jgi:aminopeptidase
MPTDDLASPFTPDELLRYARVTVGRCLDLRAGETVLISYEPEHRPFAVAAARAAYERGFHVATTVRDPLIQRAELELASPEVLGHLLPWERETLLERTRDGSALLHVIGESALGVLDGVDPARTSLRMRRIRDAVPELARRMAEGKDSFVIVGYPTKAWARKVYPDLPVDEALRALAGDLLRFCRIGPDDGEGDEALGSHLAMLGERIRVANDLALRELHFRGPGTDLRVGLTKDAVWRGGEAVNGYGRSNLPNLPTDEIFTAPAASATEGSVRCTLPLSYQGRLFEDLRAEFAGGRLTRLEAAGEEQREALLGLLDVDEGGRRLGEVALVDAESRVGQAGRLYWNTLYDENQACHVAFGLGFGMCRRDGAASEDLNGSHVHVDVMIGSPEVDVTGVASRGERVPLIVDGVWRPR